MLDVLRLKYREAVDWYDWAWSVRDTRVDGWLLMDSPVPTMVICLTYVYLVKVAGPNYMKNREPMNIRGFLIVYNLAQVIFSTYIFVELLYAGWWNDYSFRCQPVDYSNDEKALRVSTLNAVPRFIATFLYLHP